MRTASSQAAIMLTPLSPPMQARRMDAIICPHDEWPFALVRRLCAAPAAAAAALHPWAACCCLLAAWLLDGTLLQAWCHGPVA